MTTRLTLVVLLLTAAGCSDTPATAVSKSEETSGDEDPSMTAMARKVGAVQTPVVEEPEEEQKSASSVPKLVPKLTDVAPEKEQTQGASQWGAPETESGTPLPKRPKANDSASSAYRFSPVFAASADAISLMPKSLM